MTTRVLLFLVFALASQYTAEVRERRWVAKRTLFITGERPGVFVEWLALGFLRWFFVLAAVIVVLNGIGTYMIFGRL